MAIFTNDEPVSDVEAKGPKTQPPKAKGLGWYGWAVIAVIAIAGTLYNNAQRANRSAQRSAVPSGATTYPAADFRLRVQRVVAEVTAGRLGVIPGDAMQWIAADLPKWEQSEVSRLEATQTWWTSGDKAYLHLTNSSQRSLGAVALAYNDGPCGGPSTMAFIVKLSAPLPPTAATVVDFSPPFTPTQAACLTVTGAWH